MSLGSLFSKFFRKSKFEPSSEPDSKPAIYGGDGSSISDCAIVNCASPQMAYAIIDTFISKRHGKKDVDWKESMKLIKSDSTGGSNIREIVIELSDGSSTSYFFDVTRSMKLAGMLASMIEKNLSNGK